MHSQFNKLFNNHIIIFYTFSHIFTIYREIHDNNHPNAIYTLQLQFILFIPTAHHSNIL